MKLNISKFLQSNIHVFLFKYLHLSAGFFFIKTLGKIYYLFNKDERMLIEANIEDVLDEKDPEILKEKKRKIFNGIFSHYFEKMVSAYRSPLEVKEYIQNKVDISGEEKLEAALAQGKGLILVTAHYGAVEYIPWVLGIKQYPVSVIMDFQTNLLKKALQNKIDRMQADVCMLSSGHVDSVYKSALDSLAFNRILITECDEVDTWRKKKNRTIELFGKELFYDNTIDVLSRRSGAPVMGVFLKREAHGRFTLELETLDESLEEKRTAGQIFRLFERKVRANPEQWYQWKKWKKMKA